jgi:tetratricopeptide (TPR) repeat protein
MAKPRVASADELAKLAAERHGDPSSALQRVDALLASPNHDLHTEGMAHWIRGLLLHELARPIEAVDEFDIAIDLACKARLPDIEARARANRAVTLTQLGRTDEAAIDLAGAVLVVSDTTRGFVTYITALFDQRRGLHREAIAGYDAALTNLVRVGDDATVGVLHLNRGVAHSYLGDDKSARRDFRDAESAAVAHGLVILGAMAAHNLGFLEGRGGHLPDALRALDRAEARYGELAGRPRQLPVLHSDRAEILLLAGLASESRVSAARAVQELQAEGNFADLEEARLLFARACIATGETEEAYGAARLAAGGFRLTRRSAWFAQACYVARQADLERRHTAGEPTARLARRFVRLADQLDKHGWPVEAGDAMVLAALASVGSDIDAADRYLEVARKRQASGVSQYRARWHYVRALTRLARGDASGALRQVAVGVADSMRVTADIGATEVRVEALRYAGELTALATTIAYRSDRVGLFMDAIERQRSINSYVVPVRTAPDPSAHVELDALRQPTDARGLVESAVRERSLRTSGIGATSSAPRLPWSALRPQLRDRALVYYAEADGELVAVVCEATRRRIVPLALASDASRRIAFAHFSLERATIVGGQSDEARRRLERDLIDLDRLLVVPLELRAESVVVVPSPLTLAAPWMLLPSLRNVDLAVAPSARSWLRALDRGERPHRRIVLVAGPRLGDAEAETADLQRLYPHAEVLMGQSACVADVLAAMEGADLVHIAAHGLFRAESPMFSNLELADGPLTVYDLEQLERPPMVVVLSACEAGRTAVYRSGGVLGVANVLLALGTTAVVAASRTVDDTETRAHMVAFHSHLCHGAGLAEALRQATGSAIASGNAARLAAAGAFVTFGAG